MGIRVALQHKTVYRYDRDVQLGPQIVRLRPAPHCRTPVLGYSMKVFPEDHFCNWQQDPQGNYIARLVFPEKTRLFSVVVDLIADMTSINPFDFFLESYAEEFPFSYESWLLNELAPYLETLDQAAEIDSWIESVDRTSIRTIDLITELNRRLQQEIRYEIRMEPGVQSPAETLQLRSGSCRDSAWLLVHILRRLGLAARFASGYLIQLTSDVKSLDGPSGPEKDFTDLHAWSEVYLPGAGWIGLDPTSGLLCGEGHLPVACTPDPFTAAPVTGGVDEAECDFHFEMSVTRVVEDPRTTKPYTQSQWERINALGLKVDDRLQQDDVRLTFGGEPTFVSMDDMDGPEWNSDAVGPTKRVLSGMLIKRLRATFAPEAFLHYGQGKWYPGESLPRWALTCMWRIDGKPIWQNPDLIADESRDYGHTFQHARRFSERVAEILEIDPRWLMPAYEDTYYYLWKEQRLPINVDPWDPKLEDAEERSRLTRVFSRGLHNPVGLVLPMKRQWWQGRSKWTSGPWPVRPEKLLLLPGDSAVGLRLPLDTLPQGGNVYDSAIYPVDPFSTRPPLPSPTQILLRKQTSSEESPADETPGDALNDFPLGNGAILGRGPGVSLGVIKDSPGETPGPRAETEGSPGEGGSSTIRTALCVEPRDGRLYIFMPPTETLEDYLELLTTVEQAAADLRMPVVIEGYLPPRDHRVEMIKVTPDPGVIEVNIHPSRTWKELVDNTTQLYEEARHCRLATEKFDLDGKHTGTGGGNHIVMGGPSPSDSPFLRAPHVLRSLVAFWINHPSLSYLFSNRFIGPTSQAPRADEGRHDAVYELQTALELIPPKGSDTPPWLVDRILRNLLIDLTGNTHRAEICIDKLYSPDSSTGRLGLVELRGFEMPPHPQMSLATQLLIRNLIATFWRQEYREPLIRWGNELHDRFMLPHFVWNDFLSVLSYLQQDGWEWEENWFTSHFEFRFPPIGAVEYDGVSLQLRTAIEPWYVMGEEPGGGGTVRYVDSSVERLEVKGIGLDMLRHRVLCNGIQLPMQSTGGPATYVCGVRYRAWQPPSCLHPTIPVHTPMVVELWDVAAGRSLGGCTYHVGHPGGRNYETFPVNALEAEARRTARFIKFGHTPGHHYPRLPRPNPEFPATLDLRRER